jgi:polyferredoxin/Flp pilus assembly protein TadD
VVDQSAKTVCGQHQKGAALPPSFISPEATPRGPVRPSRMSKRRAAVLILIHVALLAHIIHWRIKGGATISPLEPSEAMYTLRDGIVNAGAIVLVLSILSTLVLGRFFCGWGCHVVALQDFCAWLLKKIGIHPRPLRSRLLVFVPLLAGLYMFFWPSFMGLVNGIPPPHMKDGMLKIDFWDTFPGFWIGFLTFLVCGFVIVYLLGAKGFCTYACPYGGLFGVVDKLATGRIRVTDACKQCGHCTSVCTSNVLVSREVLEYGMVVDPGCMKCQDCISVCPENALYFGFGKPALFAKARRKLKKIAVPHFSWREELALVGTFAAALLVFRGVPQVQVGPRVHFTWAESLYGDVPLLFGLGLAAITSFVVVFAWRVLRRPEADYLGIRMKSGGKATGAGKVFLTLAALWMAFLVQSAAVQWRTWQGLRLLERDEAVKHAVWWHDEAALAQIPPAAWDRWREGDQSLAAADGLGLVDDVRIPRERSWFALAQGRLDDAIALLREAIRRRPAAPNSYRDLAHIHLLRGEPQPAIDALRAAIRVRERDVEARGQLVMALIQKGDVPAALVEQRAIVDLIGTPESRVQLASLVLETGDFEGGIAILRGVVADRPDFAGAHATLGLALQATGREQEARTQFDAAEQLDPGILRRLPQVDTRPAPR